MTKYVITEEQLKAVTNFHDWGDEFEAHLKAIEQIRFHPLSDEHVWMTPEEEEKKIRKDERGRVLKSFESIFRFRQHSINADCIYASDLDITIEAWSNYD